MYAVEFQTNVKDGIIEIPQEYKERFKQAVRVILLTEEPKGSSDTLIDRLLAAPLQISEFQPLKRDAIYER